MGGVLPSGAELHIYKEGEKKTLGGEKRRSSSIVHQKQLGTLQEDMRLMIYLLLLRIIIRCVGSHMPFHH